MIPCLYIPVAFLGWIRILRILCEMLNVTTRAAVKPAWIAACRGILTADVFAWEVKGGSHLYRVKSAPAQSESIKNADDAGVLQTHLRRKQGKIDRVALVVVWTHKFDRVEVAHAPSQAAEWRSDTRRALAEDVIVSRPRFFRRFLPEDNLDGVQFSGGTDMLVLRSVLLG